MIQLKPRTNTGIEKKKQAVDKGQGKQLFIVGPWVKKAGGGVDLESMRQENQDNMNMHLNWHADDVLTFELTLFNPLKVPLPLTLIELFREGSDLPLASLGCQQMNLLLPPNQKSKYLLNFRAQEAQDIVISHLELSLFEG